MAKKSAVEIGIDISINGQNYNVGLLRYETRARNFLFSYSSSWLANPHYFALQPSLDGVGWFSSDTIFPFISDAMPDRWGRRLIEWNSRHEILDKDIRRVYETTHCSDLLYLLGVEDKLRMGGLRFYVKDEAGTKESSAKSPAIKYLSDSKISDVSLAQLADGIRKFENNELSPEINMLIAPGSSLGGSRPKATVLYKNSLWLAKFSKQGDDYNVPAWEYINLEMARECGLTVPETRLERIGSGAGTLSVFMTRRFDRKDDGERIPYISALTLLNARDMERHSYIEIVDALETILSLPEKDIKELWKRIVFNVLITNIDDHLRNHGFLYNGNSFVISPLFDLESTPNPGNALWRTGLYSGGDRELTLGSLREASELFRVGEEEAANYIYNSCKIVSRYADFAQKCGLKGSEIRAMESAYRPAVEELTRLD